MNWRFWRKPEPEQRSTAQGYTALYTAAFQAGAEAAPDTAPLATAALEAPAGLYSKCMAAAVVTGADQVAAALTAPVLALIARNLIRRGEDHQERIGPRGRGSRNRSHAHQVATRAEAERVAGGRRRVTMTEGPCRSATPTRACFVTFSGGRRLEPPRKATPAERARIARRRRIEDIEDIEEARRLRREHDFTG